MGVEEITFEGIKFTFLVLLGLGGAVITIDKTISAIKHLFGGGKQDTDARLNRVKERIGTDEERLEDVEHKVEHQESDISSIKKDMRQVLTALNVLLQHEITGNSIDNLKKTKAALDLYLIETK